MTLCLKYKTYHLNKEKIKKRRRDLPVFVTHGPFVISMVRLCPRHDRDMPLPLAAEGHSSLGHSVAPCELRSKDNVWPCQKALSSVQNGGLPWSVRASSSEAGRSQTPRPLPGDYHIAPFS